MADVADARARLRGAAERDLTPADVARRRRHEGRQDPEQRRLARAVRTEDGAHLPGREGRAHVDERAPTRVRLADLPQGERARRPSWRVLLFEGGELLVDTLELADELATALGRRAHGARARLAFDGDELGEEGLAPRREPVALAQRPPSAPRPSAGARTRWPRR